MLTAALFLGALVAFYFGLRAGLWAAAATLGVLTALAFLPLYKWPVYGVLAGAAVLVQVVGSRRRRPPQTVRALRWVRAQVHVARALWGRGNRERDRDRKRDRHDFN